MRRMPNAEPEIGQSILRAKSYPVGHQPGAAARPVYRAAWAQRRGQDHAGQLHHGACAGGERQHDLAARGSAAAKSAAATDGAPRRTRHQPRPARAATLLAAERGGESAGGADGRARCPSPHSAADLQPVSQFAPDAYPPRRRSVRRRSTPVGDRSCAGAGAGAADPRRTDDGCAPFNRRRHRQRDPQAQL